MYANDLERLNQAMSTLTIEYMLHRNLKAPTLKTQ